MARHDTPKRRTRNRREFPAGLVVLGLLLVAIVWLAVFRPHPFDPLSPHPASAPLPHAGTPAPETASAPPSDPMAAPLTPVRETPPAEPADSGGKSGNFYRYTDEQGVIHLVDDPDAIPGRYRQQTKVYRETYRATRVRVVENQVLVPVTLRNGGRTVQATLVLDTGCAVTTISAALADRLGIDPSLTEAGTARVADGRRVPARRAVIDQLTAGPKTKAPLEVTVMPVAGPQELADGLLGMNFLRDFRYQIDTAGQQIHWR